MAVNSSRQKNTQSLSGKVILALLLACIVILLSWGITKVTFTQMLRTVNQMSAPNPKLQLVNRLFREVVQLEQLQREQALRTHIKTNNTFLLESNNIALMLDTLQTMCAGDSQQLRAVQSMKKILHERDKLYLNYLTMRTEYFNNDTLKQKLQSLTDMLDNDDRNVVTTNSRKITTTTIVPADDIRSTAKPSLWNKLFGKKKEESKPQQLIKEELNITTDTLKLTNTDSTLQELSETIATAENTRTTKRNKLLTRQMQLNQTGNVFIGRILEILNSMEHDESLNTAQNNIAATKIVNRNLWWMNLLLIIFIGCAAVLTFLILTDIVKSNRYKKALIIAKEEAEELTLIKQRFLANMSHELRTPLQAIVGMAEQVNLKGNASVRDLNMIYQSSQHLLQIVNEVLDYSLLTSGKFRLEEKNFSLTSLLDEVRNVMLVKAAEKGLELNFLKGEDSDMLHLGDPFRLKQILYNLLGNAIKFTDKGSVELHVEQKNFSAYSLFTFTIKDTGRGIGEEDVKSIFNQFEQGSAITEAQQQGTGLGLSIVQSLVDSLKGTIKVESTVGVGSVFTVTLPYTISKNIDVALSNAHQEYLTVDIGEVWVIDDDYMILQLCKHILDKHKINNRCFSTPEDIILAVRNSQPQIVLMDIRMPTMTGFELLRILKPLLPHDTRIVALTAHALPDDKEDILRPGFTDLLMKPFMERDLLAILGAATDDEPKNDKPEKELYALYNITGGDHQLLKQILQQFATDTMADSNMMLQMIEDGNYEQVAEVLHKLAGRCGQVGFKELGIELRTVEIQVRNGNTENLSLQSRQLYKHIATVLDTVNTHIQTFR